MSLLNGFEQLFKLRGQSSHIRFPSKKRKTFFYKCVLELHFTSISGLGVLSNKSKSLFAIVHYIRTCTQRVLNDL
jgi:hypothetical protein